MKFSEIRDLTVEELKKRDRTLKEELFELKMKHSLGQSGSPILIRDTRKNIAKVKTALNMKLS